MLLISFRSQSAISSFHSRLFALCVPLLATPLQRKKKKRPHDDLGRPHPAGTPLVDYSNIAFAL